MAALKILRLPESPVEKSGAARACVLAAFGVACLAIAVYGQDYLVPAIAFGVAALGHRSSYLRRDRPRGRARQAVIAGLMIACLAYFLLDSVLAIFGGQLPQAHFAMLLVAVTSFDLKTRRNLYSSLFISLTILYLAAVYAWDYPFGLFVVAWAGCLGGFWVASHLSRLGAEMRVPARPVALALAGSMAAGVAAFFLLPQPSTQPSAPLIVSLPSSLRFQGELENPALPLVQFGSDPSGANSSVDLRYRGRLGDDVVMYVRTGAPAYWRGLIFDHYAAGQWTATRAGQYQDLPPYVDRQRLPPPEGPQSGTFVQVFRIVQPLPGVIYSASPVEAMYFPAAQIRLDAYGAWRAPGPLKAGQTYSVVSYLPDYTPASLQRLSGPDIAPGSPYLDPGPLSARARTLARTAVGAAEGRYEQVMALTGYLQSHYQYSLQLGHVPAGTDPVDWFLFDSGIGYCEQFATAETLMLRSLGIPARLATGYATGDYSPTLDQAVVHARDAHAWVEAYFQGHGWVPIDPSPGYSALAAARFPDRWAASGIARLIPRLTIGAPVAVLGSLGWIALLPGALALLVAAWLGASWLWARRRHPGRAPDLGQAELIALYDRLQRRLGRRRSPPETPREYLGRASAGSLAPLLEEVTEAVNRGAYGGCWPEPEQVLAWRERLS